MCNKTSKIFYRIDLNRTLNSMEVNKPAIVKIAGKDRDCALSSLHSIRSRIEDKTDKKFQICQCDNGTIAEIIRIK